MPSGDQAGEEAQVRWSVSKGRHRGGAKELRSSLIRKEKEMLELRKRLENMVRRLRELERALERREKERRRERRFY